MKRKKHDGRKRLKNRAHQLCLVRKGRDFHKYTSLPSRLRSTARPISAS